MIISWFIRAEFVPIVSTTALYLEPSDETVLKPTTGPCQLQTLAHASYVTQAGKSMFQRLSLSQPFIAVHVRSERISQPEFEWHRTGFIDSCMMGVSMAVILCGKAEEMHPITLYQELRQLKLEMYSTNRKKT